MRVFDQFINREGREMGGEEEEGRGRGEGRGGGEKSIAGNIFANGSIFFSL